MIYEVITSENVPFTYRVAGVGSRFLAWLVDLGVILVVSLMGAAIASVLEMGRQGLGLGIVMVWTFVVQWGYFLLFEWLWRGQTPGKRMLGIRVIRLKGTGLSFPQAAVRNLLRVVDGLPLLIMDLLPLLYGVGFLAAVCTREHRRLGDLAAGTLVVYVEHRPTLAGTLPSQGSEAERTWTALVSHRLEGLTRNQKQTLLELCLRREQLRVRERARLFSVVAAHFKSALDLAPREYQSDEKFLLQLAAVLSSDSRVAENVVARRAPFALHHRSKHVGSK
jgi:uncharacterized RDD family membrane protein YckC